MLINGEVPEVLMPAVKTLLEKGVEILREEVDVAELYFADFSWLGLSDPGNQDNNSSRSQGGEHDDDGGDDGIGRIQRREKVRVDAVRKVVLRREARVRKCTRCWAVVDERPPATRNLAVVQGMRACLCGDWWMRDDGGRE